MSGHDLHPLPIRRIFEDAKYVIPIYQRAYAWSADEIATLLRDVRDSRLRSEQERPRRYHIGSLVTHERVSPLGEASTFEVVDGQQRLTTLFILLTVLGGHSMELGSTLIFEGRSRSSGDLALLSKRGTTCAVDDLNESGIAVGVETVRSARDTGEFTTEDLEYLLDHVLIVRSVLPASTDLNHYFEIMNSRGEQLEKHEVVKAALMGMLASSATYDASSSTLAAVWDACSDLGRHVEAGFGASDRSALFGPTWDQFLPRTFAEVQSKIDASHGEGKATLMLEELLSQEPIRVEEGESDDTDETDRYESIIDFPNFLLHVLRLSVEPDARFAWETADTSPIPLDDKRLVELFDQHITTAEQVENFTYQLLRVRWLFDRYVIKTDQARDAGDRSHWVMHKVGKVGRKLSPVNTFARRGETADGATTAEHRHLVVLQSMFQVTDSRRPYKNFLLAILQYLTQRQEIDPPDFVAFLEALGSSRARSVGLTTLDRGTSSPRFIFNYLDYLLWREQVDPTGIVPELKAALIAPESRFRFRYRTSVEHFYPQHPDSASTIDPLPKDVVDQFGNLCLMTNSQNSQRSNLAPEAKIRQYKSDEQTLKFQLMAELALREGWNPVQFESHGRAMRDLLRYATEPG